jgi:chromosome partitioning protein
MDKENLVLTQRTMSLLSGEHASTISRALAAHKIAHLETGNIRNLKYSLESCRPLLQSFLPVNKDVLKKVWGFYNFKGGTGKTSLCFQVSTHLALMGYDVLVIDSDPQGNLSSSLGFETTDAYMTLYDVVINRISPEEAIKEIFPGYYCIPSNISCSRFDMELTMMGRREEQFRQHLSHLKRKFDFIIFDTNPYISFVVRNVLVFSDMINIPCETQPYSLNALKVLFEDLDRFYKEMQLDHPDFTIIPNKYEDRYGTSAEAMHILRKNYESYLIPNFAVRKAEDFNIAAREGMPLACVAKRNSIALEDILELRAYLLKKSFGQEIKLAA